MKHSMRPALVATFVLVALGAFGMPPARAKSTPAAAPVSKAQASEIVGYELAERFPKWAHDMVDPQQVGHAVTRALEGQKPTMSEAELKIAVPAFGREFAARAKQEFDKVSAQNEQAGNAYLASNRKRPGVHVAPDGLQYQVISQGTGPKPQATDTVQVNYTATFVNGQEFDSSARHGSGPASVQLQRVFPGLREALMLMPVGSHYAFAIPADLAYGSDPKNGFPPNETLLFDITLVKIGAG